MGRKFGTCEEDEGTHRVVIGKLKERVHLEDPGIEGKMMLKLFLDSFRFL